MILEQLSLRNWRSYRERQTFRLSPRINLFVGPNEAGKSTLFEALHRALFDRHNSQAKELVRVQPLGSSLGPEVELVLVTGDERYRVVKRFLVEARSELYTERQGRFELDHEGDRADERLRRLLGGVTTRGATQARHRGLAQALWYLQREEGVPPKAWAEALREGLSGLVNLALRTPQEEAVVRRLFRLRDQTYTPTGRVKSASELSVVEREVAQLEEELASRRTELDRAEAYRGELAEIEHERGRHEAELAAQRLEHRELIEVAEGWLKMEREKEERERRLAVLSDRVADLDRRLESLTEREERCRALECQLEATEELETELQVAVRQHRRTAERHARRWESELQPKLRAATVELEELRARLRLDELEEEAERLRQQLARGERLGEERQELERRLEEAPADREWRRLVRARDELEVLEERTTRGAIRVRFEIDAGQPLSVAPPAPIDADEGAYLVSRPTAFELPAGGRVLVRAGDDMLEQLGRRAAGRRAEVGAALERYGARDLAQIERRVEERRAATARLAELDARLRELVAGGAAQRLAEVERELRRLRGRVPQRVLPGIEGWAKERSGDELRELEERQRHLEAALAREREAEQQAQRICLAKSEELREASKRGAELRSELKTLRRQSATEIEAFGGSLAALRRRCEEANASLAAARDEQTAFLAAYRDRVEEPRQRMQALEEAIGAAQRELGRCEREVADRLARLEEIATLGLYGQVGDLEGRLEARRERGAVVRRRAEAARILADLIVAYRDHQTRALTVPLTNLLEPWLRHLTDNAYDGLTLDETLMPTGARSTRYASALPMESLSYGTHEQIVVLLRLAMGVLLSGEERQLVVLDDRLVNADAARVKRLCDILGEAAEHCQILLATCSPGPYAGLEAEVLNLAAGEPPAEATRRRGETVTR